MYFDRVSRREALAGIMSAAIGSVAHASAAELPPKVLRIGGQGNPDGRPYGSAVIGVVRAGEYLEREFAKDGTAIDWQFPRGTGPAINEAIANGQLDFANYGGLPNIVGRGGGLRTKVIASYGTLPTYVVARTGSGIERLEDLKGRKVTVSRGTVIELALNRFLEKVKLTEADVQLFDLISTDQIAAVGSGDVDAVVGTSNLLPLVGKGAAKVIASTKGKVDPASGFGSFVVTESFAAQYPQTTARVMRAFLQAARFASDEANRDKLIDMWALTGQPRDTIAADYQGDSLADRNSPLIDNFFVANVKNGIHFALDAKLIRRPVDADAWIDRSYLDAAVKALGYEKVWAPHDANGAVQG